VSITYLFCTKQKQEASVSVFNPVQSSFLYTLRDPALWCLASSSCNATTCNCWAFHACRHEPL
jgi:hypothetical protein